MMMKRPKAKPKFDEENAEKLRMLNAHTGIDPSGALRVLFVDKETGKGEAYHFSLEDILEAQRRG